MLEALNSFKPQIAAQHSAIVTSMFDGMVREHGPALRGVANCWTYAKMWNGTVRQYARKDESGAYVLDADRLAAGSAEYADAVVTEWAGKITEKMGEIEGATVHALTGVSFCITGTKGGRAVSIVQNMIVNVSSQGKPFNQFPARISVDGKAISAAAYKKL